MKYLLLLSLFLVSTTLFAQKTVELEDLKNHIGDSVKVSGKVYGIRHLPESKNAPTFINVGGAYPNQLLTILIWGDVRKTLKIDLTDTKFATAMAAVTGKLELYKGKPQIVIRDAKQLDFLYDEEVKAGELPEVGKQ